MSNPAHETIGFGMLPGAGQGRASMGRLERLFERAGYPSVTADIPVDDTRFRISDYGRMAAEQFLADEKLLVVQALILVGHSMAVRELPFAAAGLENPELLEKAGRTADMMRLKGLVAINGEIVKPPSSRRWIDPTIEKYQPGYRERAIRDMGDGRKEFKRPESDEYLLNDCNEEDKVEITSDYRPQTIDTESPPIDWPKDADVLVLAGEDDRAINPDFTAATGEYVDATVERMPGGHFMHISRTPAVALKIAKHFGLRLVQSEFLHMPVAGH